MPVGYPDILIHNNPNKALVDSDFIRGGKRTPVADLTTLYALGGGKIDQLKENSTIVFIIAEGVDYVLTDIANANNSAGWEVYWNQSFSTLDTRYSLADGSNIDWTGGYTTYDARYLSLSGGTMTGPLILSVAPTIALGAATKNYVDNAVNGAKWKGSVLVMSTSNLTLSGHQTVNTVALVTGDRMLANGQTDATENGPYIVDSGAWTRAADGDIGTELVSAAFLIGTGDSLNPNTQWVCGNPSPITIGVTDIFFNQFGGPGSYTNGTGLDLSGLVFSITPNGVTYSLLQQVAANSLVGNATGSTANAQEITIGAGLTFSMGALVNSINNTNQLTNGAGFITNSTGFIQGGNSFAAAARIGTNDAFDLEFEVNNVKKMTLNQTTGNLDLINGLKLPVSSSSAGIIWQVNNRLLHTYGTDCLFVGTGSGNFTKTEPTSTGGNIGIGTSTLVALTSGESNTAVGAYVLNANTSASNLTAMGYGALFKNTTGTFNNAFGSSALFNNTTGNNNNAFGSSVLKANTTGANNFGFGASALLSNTTGGENVAFGTSAGRFNTIGNHNFYFGTNSGRNNVNGSGNIGIGFQSLTGVSGNSFSNNTAIGDQSGNGLTIGSNNVFIGYNNGFSATTASNDILIGYNLALPSSTTSNYMSLGNMIFGTGIDGTGTTVSAGKIGIGIAAPTYYFSVKDEFYYDGINIAGLVASVNNSLSFVVQNTNVGTAARSLFSVYNDDGNGMDIGCTSTVFTTSGNVLQHDRSVINSNSADGLHIWNTVASKSINFWIGALSSEVSLFEISTNVTNTKNAVADKIQVISGTVQLPDNVSNFVVDNGTNAFNMPLNPVDGQLVEFISNNGLTGYNLTCTAPQSFRQQGFPAGTSEPIAAAGVSSRFRWVNAKSAWIRLFYD